jgi:hypothetical protein
VGQQDRLFSPRRASCSNPSYAFLGFEWADPRLVGVPKGTCVAELAPADLPDGGAGGAVFWPRPRFENAAELITTEARRSIDRPHAARASSNPRNRSRRDERERAHTRQSPPSALLRDMKSASRWRSL